MAYLACTHRRCPSRREIWPRWNYFGRYGRRTLGECPFKTEAQKFKLAVAELKEHYGRRWLPHKASMMSRWVRSNYNDRRGL